MELEVYWLQLAENKLDDIYSYYRINAGKQTAQKLISRIINTTINLDKQPKIGQVEISLSERKQQFRYLVFRNYKIVYWINHDFSRIEIANIFDTRQEPEKIQETE